MWTPWLHENMQASIAGPMRLPSQMSLAAARRERLEQSGMCVSVAIYPTPQFQALGLLLSVAGTAAVQI